MAETAQHMWEQLLVPGDLVRYIGPPRSYVYLYAYRFDSDGIYALSPDEMCMFVRLDHDCFTGPLHRPDQSIVLLFSGDSMFIEFPVGSLVSTRFERVA